MSLSPYTDLRNAVTGWLHRDDLAASAVDFIALAEARFRRQLRLRQQMTTAALSTVAGAETVALPSGWLQFHNMRLVAPDRVLDFLPAVQFRTRYQASDTGAPVHYTVEGSNLVLGPKPDSVYSISAVYYAEVPALSDSASTNWLLTSYPGLYLFASLAEAAPFIGQDARIATWEAKYGAELESARDADRKARSNGSGLRMRPR